MTELAINGFRCKTFKPEACEMERPIHCSRTIGLLVIIIIFIFLPKKKIFVSNLIEKLFSLSRNTFQEMLTYHPA